MTILQLSNKIEAIIREKHPAPIPVSIYVYAECNNGKHSYNTNFFINNTMHSVRKFLGKEITNPRELLKVVKNMINPKPKKKEVTIKL